MNPSILVKPLLVVGQKVLLSVLSEKVLKWGFFKLARWITASKKTPHTSEFVDLVEEQYNEQSNRVKTK